MTLNTLTNIETTIAENNENKQNDTDDIDVIIDEVVEEPLIFNKILFYDKVLKNI